MTSSSLLVVILILFCVTYCMCLDILMLVPGVTTSILLFNQRLAQLLQRNGHSVTYLVIYPTKIWPGKMPENMTEIMEFAPTTTEWKNYGEEVVKIMDNYAFADISMTDWRKLGKIFEQVAVWHCQRLLEPEFIQKLKSRKFNLILSHYYNFCPVGISKVIDVPLAWISGGNYILEDIAEMHYLPYTSSYIPSTMTAMSDRMTFVERLKNTVANAFFYVTIRFRRLFSSYIEDDLFETLEPFKGRPVDLRRHAQDIPALMINGDWKLDFPRPFVTSLFYLGELSQSSFKKSLSEEWEAIVAKGKDGIILFSLGTVVNTTRMPSQWKQALVAGLKRFPNYLVIWKVDDKLPEADGVENIHTAKWIPQRELLAHPKMKVFITHGGYNSLLEACQAGVPLLMLPLFLDQFGNARRAERLGFGLILDKLSLTPEKVDDALGMLLRNDSYRNRAKYVARVLSDRLVTAESELLNWVARLAKIRTGQWTHNMAAAQRLNLLQFYSIDTSIAIVSSISFLVALVVYTFYKSWLVLAQWRKIK